MRDQRDLAFGILGEFVGDLAAEVFLEMVEVRFDHGDALIHRHERIMGGGQRCGVGRLLQLMLLHHDPREVDGEADQGEDGQTGQGEQHRHVAAVIPGEPAQNCKLGHHSPASSWRISAQYLLRLMTDRA